MKGRNLVRTGYAALSVTDDTAPYSHVALEGPVTKDEDPEVLRKWAGIIGGRFMGDDRADEFGARNGIEGEYVCRLSIAKISGISRITE